MINFQMKAMKFGEFEITLDVISTGLEIVVICTKGRGVITSYRVDDNDGRIKVVGDSNNMEYFIPDLALLKFVGENKPKSSMEEEKFGRN